MISEFKITGFKRFLNNSFEFCPLTVLTGLNGAGKTSLIQAMLLAWEASTIKSGSTVKLNGPFYLELGTAGDVRNWASDDNIEFTIKSEQDRTSIWRFDIFDENSLYISISQKSSFLPTAFSGAPRTFNYLNAERFGPRSILNSHAVPNEELEIGIRGEYVAQILNSIGDKVIEDKKRINPSNKNGQSPLLKYELEYWLSEIIRPIEIESVHYSGTTVAALRFRSPGSEWVRAPNMGFGVSYALPIILAGLITTRGGLLIVENPEAHLHPAGQSKMGMFLAWVAACGVQVLVETHSDHILNGIRRSIGEMKYLDHQSAIVHFFGDTQLEAEFSSTLRFTPIGGVSHWPSGFFDQYQIDTASLGRIRRRT